MSHQSSSSHHTRYGQKHRAASTNEFWSTTIIFGLLKYSMQAGRQWWGPLLNWQSNNVSQLSPGLLSAQPSCRDVKILIDCCVWGELLRLGGEERSSHSSPVSAQASAVWLQGCWRGEKGTSSLNYQAIRHDKDVIAAMFHVSVLSTVYTLSVRCDACWMFSHL